MTRRQNPRAVPIAAAVIALLFLPSAHALARQGGRRRPRNTRSAAEAGRQTNLTPRRVSLSDGRTFELNLPEGFRISVAAQGLKRVRFMARSPDERVFVTDMYDLADHTTGAVYILDEFDPGGKSFRRVTPYLTRLRNPNSVAFYTDAH